MDLQQAIMEKNFTLILDPSAEYEFIDATEFIATYHKDDLEVAVVAKNEFGKVHYRSFSAPKDNKYSEYFSNFADIAKQFEIPIHAVIHSFGDSFLGQDPNYSLAHGTGEPVNEFVCPTNTSFWKYTSTVAKEVARLGVKSIILAEHLYPRIGYCMCRRCRSELKNVVGASYDLTIGEIIEDEDLLYSYLDWRAGALNSSLAEIADSVHQEFPDLPVILQVPLDPVVDWYTGAQMHLGLDLDLLSRTVDGFMFYLMPWSPMFPTTGSDDWMRLAERLKYSKNKYSNLEFSLLLGNLEAEWDTEWFESLAKETGITKLFGTMTQGKMFHIKREIHRGQA